MTDNKCDKDIAACESCAAPPGLGCWFDLDGYPPCGGMGIEWSYENYPFENITQNFE